MSEGTFRLLMVCTGNIGRSPMMERLAVRELKRYISGGDDIDVVVRSAGTWATAGMPMESEAAQALVELDIGMDEINRFTATPIDANAVAAADLVLTATREHRSAVVGLAPAAVRRAFTLHELARIAETAPPRPQVDSGAHEKVDADAMRLAVAWAAQLRGSVPRPRRAGDDDLPDPLGEPLEVYRQRAAAVEAAVERIVPYLLGGAQAG